MIAYPSIDQFRNAIKAVQHRTWYVGKDETGDAIYDRTRVPPKLIFRGYVKAHGTNAGVVYDFTTGNFEYQSRSRVLSLESDNNQFMFHMSAHEDIWADIHRQILGLLGTSVYPTKIAIFGEWCGQGIQKGVAIAEVPKMFLVFGLRVFFAGPLIGESYSDWQDDQNSIWIDPSELELHYPEERIFNIATFGKYDVEIDFANPAYSQNKIIELTEAVEAECPIGKYFGISGVGEGLVFHNIDGTLPGEIRFKSKGELHVNRPDLIGLLLNKEDELKLINVCKINNIREFNWEFLE